MIPKFAMFIIIALILFCSSLYFIVNDFNFNTTWEYQTEGIIKDVHYKESSGFCSYNAMTILYFKDGRVNVYHHLIKNVILEKEVKLYKNKGNGMIQIILKDVNKEIKGKVYG